VKEPSSDVAAGYAGLVLQHRNTTIADVLQARIVVEAPAARMLAERRDHTRVADRLQAAFDSSEIERVHFHEFNALVVELTENETLVLLTAMLEQICQATALAMPQAEDDDTLARRIRRTRQKLIDLVRAGDADGAEEHWRKHLTGAGRVLASRTGTALIDLFN
jgi:DNA-binding FadR family transcriptional regulator